MLQLYLRKAALKADGKPDVSGKLIRTRYDLMADF
jgi:hypothetical protein